MFKLYINTHHMTHDIHSCRRLLPHPHIGRRHLASGHRYRREIEKKNLLEFFYSTLKFLYHQTNT